MSTTKKNKESLVFAIALVTFGLIFIGIYKAQRHSIILNGERTEGIIDSIEINEGTESGDMYLAKGHFFAKGRKYVFEPDIWQSGPPNYKKGDKLSIVYNPDSPDDFVIENKDGFADVFLAVLTLIELVLIIKLIILFKGKT